MLKVLGVGLPRTGTATLAEALRILGFKTEHHPKDRFSLWEPSPMPSNNVDALVDMPAALYWRELLEDNTDCRNACKLILTVRDPETWWESVKWHISKIHQSASMEHICYSDDLHSLLFGCPYPAEYWYKRRFAEWHLLVTSGVASDRLLIMDIVGGDKWDKLCPFLEVEEPKAEWPWLNKKVV